jgi:transcriptional regulator with PAS, ATPase and Fis domain
MKRGKDSTVTLMDLCLEELGGSVLVLDSALAVQWSTPSARALLGTEVQKGLSAPKLLCGGAVDRPIAEALAQGRPVLGTVTRTTPKGERRLSVRGTPLGSEEHPSGWVLHLDLEEDDAPDDETDAPTLFHGMWTRDPAMKHAFHIATRAARRDSAVLVRGETGTGKELFARALHALSARAAAPFAAINCAALPANLLESELFGHVRGSFTGAHRDQPGFFKSADGGTAFLDEVAEMPLELQAKLLRVLETRTVIPVGGTKPIPVDVRIVAATHQSLRKAVEEGRFRSDLMYRLRVIPIFLPPLRERRSDVPLLAHKLIDELNRQEGRQVSRIAPASLRVLTAYPWPGNVRELRNALEYAYVVGDGPVLLPGDLPPEIASPDLAQNIERTEPSTPLASSEPPEVQRIRRALDRAGGSRERAAQMLGMSRVTLWRRLRELGIEAARS